MTAINFRDSERVERWFNAQRTQLAAARMRQHFQGVHCQHRQLAADLGPPFGQPCLLIAITAKTVFGHVHDLGPGFEIDPFPPHASHEPFKIAGELFAVTQRRRLHPVPQSLPEPGQGGQVAGAAHRAYEIEQVEPDLPSLATEQQALEHVFSLGGEASLLVVADAPIIRARARPWPVNAAWAIWCA